MATPVASNQLMTPYMAAYEGLKTDMLSINVKDNSYIISGAQSIASSAWGSSTNYNTRIMTRADMVNAGIWAAQNGTSGYSDNQCVPYGILHDYQMNNQFGYQGTALNWGENNLATNYNNYGFVDVYLYSPYYHMKTWRVVEDFLILWCWNGSNSFAGAGNICIYKGGPTYTLQDFTYNSQMNRALSWDGTWVCIMSTPWFCNAGIPSSSAYLSITKVASSTFEIGGRDNSYWTPSSYWRSSVLSDAYYSDYVYEMHNPVAVAGGTNGLRTKIYIY